jgi:hypothetical protein
MDLKICIAVVFIRKHRYIMYQQLAAFIFEITRPVFEALLFGSIQVFTLAPSGKRLYLSYFLPLVTKIRLRTVPVNSSQACDAGEKLNVYQPSNLN